LVLEDAVADVAGEEVDAVDEDVQNRLRMLGYHTKT
jgi:hypothetical protein